MAYMYILQSLKVDRYYIGSTLNLEKRLNYHQEGKSTYTKSILPIRLVFSQEYKTFKQALMAEKWLKKQKDKSLVKRIIEEGIKKEF